MSLVPQEGLGTQWGLELLSVYLFLTFFFKD